MKTTGIVRKVDELGRIVLPVEIRRLLDIDKGTVEIFADENQVYLRKYSPSFFLKKSSSREITCSFILETEEEPIEEDW